MSSLLEAHNFVFALPLLAGAALGVALTLGATLHDPDGAHDAGEGETHLPHLLHALGFGRGVPFSVMLPLLLTLWGMVGLLLNAVLEPFLRFPLLFLPFSLTGALLSSAWFGRTLAAALEPLWRRGKGMRRGDLAGRSATAVYPITPQGGVAHVRDPSGTLHRVVCRLHGEGEVPAGAELLVLEYLPLEGLYLVERHPLGALEVRRAAV